MRYAVIVGATGLTGLELTRQLVAERNGLPVRALLRRPAPELPDGVEQVVLPKLEDAALLQTHIPPGSWVFCCVGTTMAKARSQEAFKAVDLDIPAALADAAAAAGADGISVVSSAGSKANGFFFYNRVKGEMELAVQASGLPAVHIFRPGALVGKRKDARFGERIAIGISQILRPLFIGPLSKYGPTKVPALARKMIEKAKQGLRGLRVFEGRELR